MFGNRAFYEDLDNDGEEETILAKPYVTLDFRTSVDLGDFGDIFLGIDNALNVGDANYAPIPPMMVYGGFTGRFTKKKSEDEK